MHSTQRVHRNPLMAAALIAMLILACGGTTAPAATQPAAATQPDAPSADETVPEQGSSDSAVPENAPGTGGQPDLIAAEVTFDPNPTVLGQQFTANYMIENKGSADAGAFTVRLHFHAKAGLEDCNFDIDGLPAGQKAWGGCFRTVNTGSGGNYPVELTADIENEIAEANEGNNEIGATMPVGTVTTDSGGEMQVGPGQADLIVTAVSFDPAQPIKGQPFTVNYGVKNEGDGASSAFTFWLKFHALAGVADCNWDVGPLQPGGVAWGGCVRTITGNAGNYPVKGTADSESEIAESNEGNNVLETTLTLVGN